MSNVDNLYNVEKILDVRFINGKPEYKIKWENYPISQCTWEPLKNLETIPHLIEEYNKSHPMKLESKRSNSRTLISKKRAKSKNGIGNSEKNINIKQNEKIENSNEKKETEIVKNEKEEKPEIRIEEDDKDIFKVDKKLKEVVTVKMQSGKLMALVDKEGENGENTKSYISTEDLRKMNPWILLNFYESKIKFN